MAIGAPLDEAYRVVGFELDCQGEHCIDADITSEPSLARACATLRQRYGKRLASVIHLADFYDFPASPTPCTNRSTSGAPAICCALGVVRGGAVYLCEHHAGPRADAAGPRLLFHTDGPASDNDHLIGSLVVTFSIIAWGNVARPVRFINIGFGAWLLVAPALVPGYAGVAAVASVAIGIALVWLALPMGRIPTHMGAWDRVANIRLHISKSNR